MDSYAGQPIRIVPYDPGWPDTFQKERRVLARAIGKWVADGIHHVGSTAAPGVGGEPVVDILAGVEEMPPPPNCQAALADLGYACAADGERQVHRRPAGWDRLFDLHLVPVAAPLYRQMFAFRDLLRADPQMVIAYAGLKRDLARLHRDDRRGYELAKGEAIETALGCFGDPLDGYPADLR